MSKYLDSEKCKDSYIINLTKSWYPVLIYPDDVYQMMSFEFSNDVDKMNIWCEENCGNQWTTIWIDYFTPTYWFFFENQEDATFFSLSWTRTYHTQKQ